MKFHNLAAALAAALIATAVISPAQPAFAAEATVNCAIYHVVRRGETLVGLARRYGVPWTMIRDANRLRSATIHAGNRLCIPYSLNESPRFVVLEVKWADEGGILNVSPKFRYEARSSAPMKELSLSLTRPDGIVVAPRNVVKADGQAYDPNSPSLADTLTFWMPDEDDMPGIYVLGVKAVGANGFVAHAQIHFQRTCRFQVFFDGRPGACAATEAESLVIAEQRFERGRMVWIAPSTVYVMYEPPSPGEFRLIEPYREVDKAAQGPDPQAPSTPPPPGKFYPTRGFARVWFNLPQVREKLGWAVEPEKPLASKRQQASSHPIHGGRITTIYLLLDKDIVVSLSEFRGNGYTSWRYAQ